MTNEHEAQDLDQRRDALPLPRFLSHRDEDDIGTELRDEFVRSGRAAPQQAAERAAVSVAGEAAAALHVADLMAKLGDLIKVPPDVPAIGADAALKVAKCFEVVAADVRAIAADRVQAAAELQQEAETYATVLLEAGKVLAARVSAESARAYKLSLLLREAREVIAGPAPGETQN